MAKNIKLPQTAQESKIISGMFNKQTKLERLSQKASNKKKYILLFEIILICKYIVYLYQWRRVQ